MRAVIGILVVQLAFVGALERVALACPFCGGRGGAGLVENFLLLGVFIWAGRRLLRAMERRRASRQPTARSNSTEP